MKKMLSWLLIGSSITAQTAMAQNVLVGYWQAWQSSISNAPSIIRLTEVPSQYNVIDVAFANIESDSTVDLKGDDFLQGTYQQQAIADIKTLTSQGKIVSLSIGGENATFNVNSLQAENTFLSSLESVLTTYGFNGVDFDIENGLDPTANGNEKYLIDIINKLYQWSSNLTLTLTPQTANITPQPYLNNPWNSYVPLINATANEISWVQLQEYNSGSMPGLDGNIYDEGTVAFLENITPVLINSWTRGPITYNGLPASKVVIGLPATSTGAAPAGGFVPFDQVKTAMTQLRQQYPDLRGIMTWDINWDKGANYAFEQQLVCYF